MWKFSEGKSEVNLDWFRSEEQISKYQQIYTFNFRF